MVSKQLCFFNLLVFIKLVQIVRISPYGNDFKIEMPDVEWEKKLPSQIASISLKTSSYDQDLLCNGFLIAPGAVLAPQNCIFNKSSWLPYNAEDLNVEMSSSRNMTIRKVAHQNHNGIALLFLNEEVDAKSIALADKELEEGDIVQSVDMDHFKMNSIKSTYSKVVAEANCRPDQDDKLQHEICVSGRTAGSALFLNGKLAALRHESWENSPKSDKFRLHSELSRQNWIREELKRNQKDDGGLIGIIGFAAFTVYAVALPRMKQF